MSDEHEDVESGIDGTSAKELEAGLAEAQAGMGG